MLYPIYRGALTANYPEFPDGCRSAQFLFFEEVLQMFVDRSDILLEKRGNLRLAQSQRLFCEATLDACTPVVGLIEDDLTGGFVRCVHH